MGCNQEDNSLVHSFQMLICDVENSLEEGRSRSRERNQETSAVIQMRLDGGFTPAGEWGWGWVTSSKL